MSAKIVSSLALIGALVLSGCSPSSSHQDLRDFIAENKRRPPGRIEALPRIQPYDVFSYDAYQLRSPFDQPVAITANQRAPSPSSDIAPDLQRQRERLEQFDLSTLSMVGTLLIGDVLWALISDPNGSIERIKPGNYLGRNHGRVIGLSRNRIDLVEIVASGEGWLERPNIIEIRISEQE